MINQTHQIEEYMAKQKLVAFDETTRIREYSFKIKIEDRYGMVEQTINKSFFRNKQYLVVEKLAYIINRKYYFDFKVNKQIEFNLKQALEQRNCNVQCIIRKYNLIEYQWTPHFIVIQKGYKRIRKCIIQKIKFIKFGTSLSCYLDQKNFIFIYNPAQGKVIRKYPLIVISMQDLFEISDNMEYVYLEGCLYDLYNYKSLVGFDDDLYFVRFTPCCKYFNFINIDNQMKIMDIQKQEVIFQIDVGYPVCDADFIYLDIQQNRLIQEKWDNKTRFCIQFQFNHKM